MQLPLAALQGFVIEPGFIWNQLACRVAHDSMNATSVMVAAS